MADISGVNVSVGGSLGVSSQYLVGGSTTKFPLQISCHRASGEVCLCLLLVSPEKHKSTRMYMYMC